MACPKSTINYQIAARKKFKYPFVKDQRFGRLVTIEELHGSRHSGNRKRLWVCRCDCGNIIRTTPVNLMKGKATSCGCYHNELLSAQSRTHGKSKTSEYRIYRGMWERCYNPNNANYPYYGGRGIVIDERWHSFDNFYNDMGQRPTPLHTVERLDNDKPYSRDNCVWATRKEQANNQRSNTILEFNGERHNIAEWAEITKISARNISNRLRYGWSVEAALTTPIMSAADAARLSVKSRMSKK